MRAAPMDTHRDAESIRVFESDFLEFFTHISPVTVVAIWLPVAAYVLVRAVMAASGATFPWYIPLGVLVGLVLWTATEYIMHRYVFHYEPRNPTEERIMFMFHGVHHARPQDKTRLVMPLPASVPMAVLFYGLFYGIVGVVLNAPHWVSPLMGGFILGYLAYDLTHYAAHHFPMRSGYAKFIKRYHMAHHYKDPDVRFGVSTPVWDYVFGTTGTDE